MAILSSLFGKGKKIGGELAESFVVASFQKLFNSFLDNPEKMKDVFPGAISFVQALSSGKGLQDQHVWGVVLENCGLQTEERKLLIQKVREMRSLGGEKETVANNFIIATTMGMPSKDGHYPGEKILHGFIHRLGEFSTEKEKLEWIEFNIRSIGTDARVVDFVDSIKKTGSETWDKIKKVSEEGVSKIDAVSSSLEGMYQKPSGGGKVSLAAKKFWDLF